jgi:hypothetical protein
VIVVLDDLAARGGGRIVGRLAFRVLVADDGARDERWLTLGASDAGKSRPFFTGVTRR